MADILRTDPTSGIVERFKDMGDGTWALVESVQSIAAPTSPPYIRRPYVAGKWYAPPGHYVVNVGVAMPGNSIRLIPFDLLSTMTVSDLGAHVGTVDAVNPFQLAIYNADTTTGLPTTLVGATGDLSGASATQVSGAIAGGSKLMVPGAYFMAINTASTTLIMKCMSAASPLAAQLMGNATLANISSSTGASWQIHTYSQTYGTWPDLTGLTTSTSTTLSGAIVFLKAA